MRHEGETEIFGEMEGIYNRGRHLGEIRKLRKCDRLGREF